MSLPHVVAPNKLDVPKNNTYSRCADLEGRFRIKQCALDRKFLNP